MSHTPQNVASPDEGAIRLKTLPVLEPVELVHELDGAEHLDLRQAADLA